jgi:hypothetical protein
MNRSYAKIDGLTKQFSSDLQKTRLNIKINWFVLFREIIAMK